MTNWNSTEHRRKTASENFSSHYFYRQLLWTNEILNFGYLSELRWFVNINKVHETRLKK